MSVFTEVTRAELENFLDAYDLGALVDYAGIEAGIENTNYFVTCRTQACVLTLFETTPAADADYCLSLMAYLAERGIAVAPPLADHAGRFLSRLNGKPAALVKRLPGASVERPALAHLAAIGRALAQMHSVVADFPARRSSERGRDWRQAVALELHQRLEPSQRRLVEEILAEADLEQDTRLPGGVIHADLFRDNALFVDQRLSGIIDFYYAHNGPFIYDLAVTVADWCFNPLGRFNTGHAQTLCAAYTDVRGIDAAERSAWPAAFRAAGARFWLSRLKDALDPRDGALTHIKDPTPFRRVFEFGRDCPEQLDAVWD